MNLFEFMSQHPWLTFFIVWAFSSWTPIKIDVNKEDKE